MVPRPNDGLSFGGTEGVEDENDDQMNHETGNQQLSQHLSQHPAATAGSQDPSPGHAGPQEVEGTSSNFQIGDHVYMWSTLYQRHGIVLHLDGDGTVLIADFSVQPISETPKASNSTSPEVVRFRSEHAKHTKWRKVKYGVNKWERAVKPPGTCTCEIPYLPQIILQRINFLMLHDHLLPTSHPLLSNSEAMAFWCTTGQWRTLQMGQMLHISSAASVVGTGSIATYAAAESVRLCCLLGAELAVTAPLLLPVIAVGSLAAGGATVWNSHRMRREWKRITELLNHEYDKFQLLYEEGLTEKSRC